MQLKFTKMKVKLKKYGANSQAVVIPKAILELFGMDQSTMASFEPSTDELVIRIKSNRSKKIALVTEKILKKHKNLYQTLAEK